MLARRASESHLTTMLHKLTDWATLGDYDRAKQAATDRIVKKQSRGSVSAQNGWYMTRKKLLKMSRRADKAIDLLRRSFP